MHAHNNIFIGCYGWEMVFRASSGWNYSICDIWLLGSAGGSVNPKLKSVNATPPGVYISGLANHWRQNKRILSIPRVQRYTYIVEQHLVYL